MQNIDALIKSQFHTDGYIVLEGLRTPEEINLFNNEL